MRMNLTLISEIIILLVFITFITFIFVGGGFLTNILWNSDYDVSCVGLNTQDKRNIAKMTMIMFWIVFILLCILLPIHILLRKYIDITFV